MPKAKKSKEKEGIVTAKIIPTKDITSERIYANFVTIDHSAFDFTLRFCDIGAPTETEKVKIAKDKTINAPIQVEIIAPINLIPALINALTINYNKYNETYEKQKK